jgi:hypothetical protein
MTPQEIALKLKELSDLEDLIKKSIKSYNQLANKIDTERRLALLLGDSSKVYSSDDKHLKMSHNEYILNSGRPGTDIYGPDTSGWFPSEICY